MYHDKTARITEVLYIFWIYWFIYLNYLLEQDKIPVKIKKKIEQKYSLEILIYHQFFITPLIF